MVLRGSAISFLYLHGNARNKSQSVEVWRKERYMNKKTAQNVWNELKSFAGEDSVRKLYCTILNYPFKDEAVPLSEWPEGARKFVHRARVVARADSFSVIYVVLDRLTRTIQRDVMTQLLRRYADCVIVFADPKEKEFHITNPRYDPETDRPFILRRFAVGATERLRTASERLALTLAEEDDAATRLKAKHDEAFDVEVVTKEFFEAYKKCLLRLQSHLLKQKKGSKQQAREFALQLMNRLMFLYFIQKKGWLAHDHGFVSSYLRRYQEGEDGSGFFRGWLEPLFFYAFNNKGVPDSYELLAEVRTLLSSMPFLNGGLFERREGLDNLGFEISDDEITRIINGFLDRYNFTIREDTPLDVDVAVDPEMLGKVYEALVLEEERKGRRRAGIFYTPRPEVDFMCRQSIIEYLGKKTEVDYERIVEFAYGELKRKPEELSGLASEEAREVAKALVVMKVVDPACGSGAFLVGLLHVLCQLMGRLGIELGWKKESEFTLGKRIIEQNLYGVDIKEWAVRVAELRLWLALIVEAPDELLESQKGPLLPNFTFKLRVGDSLVQELGGEPLTLEYVRRLVEGQEERFAAIAKLKSDHYDALVDVQIDKVREMVVKAYIARIRETKRRLERMLRREAAVQQMITQTQTAIPLSAETEVTKEDIKKEIRKLDLLERDLWEEGMSRDNFFWPLDFPEIFAQGGFDLVIGNPPYVRQENIMPANLPIREVSDSIKKSYKEAVVRNVEAQWEKEFQRHLQSDFYVYFLYQGLALLKNGGILCFITSNSWLEVQYGEKLQKFLLNNSFLHYVVELERAVFPEQEVDTAITLLSKCQREDMFWDKSEKNASKVRFVRIRKPMTHFDWGVLLGAQPSELARLNVVSQDELNPGKWSILLRAPQIYQKILKHQKMRPLKAISDSVFYGLKSGCDDYFIIEKDKANRLGIENEFLRPCIPAGEGIKGLTIRPEEIQEYFFVVHEKKHSLKGTNALKYIHHGEKLVVGPAKRRRESRRLTEIETIRNRKTWYSLPRLETPTAVYPMWFRYKYRAFLNGADALGNNYWYYIVIPKENGQCLVAYLNSSLAQLLVELSGRQYSGILMMMVYELRRLPCLDISSLSDSEKKSLETRFSELDRVLVDASQNDSKNSNDKVQRARKNLDAVIYDILELSDGERIEVEEGLKKLRESRMAKSKS